MKLKWTQYLTGKRFESRYKSYYAWEHCNELRNAFPEPVVELVQELTNPSKGSDLPRADRKRMDREHLAKASIWAKRIKLVDRLMNLLDVGNGPVNFVRLYAHESLLLVQALAGTHEGLETEVKVAAIAFLDLKI